MPDWRHIPEAGTVLGIRLLVLLARVCGRRIAGWLLYLVVFSTIAMTAATLLFKRTL